jgi:superfamily II DNA/RNA helicase
LKDLKYEKPKPIQMQAITIGFEMKDLIAIAPTGEGKTLAYLIPILNFILPLERVTGVNS